MEIDYRTAEDLAIDLHYAGQDTVHFLNQYRLEDIYTLHLQVPHLEIVRRYYEIRRPGLYDIWSPLEEVCLCSFVHHYPFGIGSQDEIDFPIYYRAEERNFLDTRQRDNGGLLLFYLPEEGFINRFSNFEGNTILNSNGRLPYSRYSFLTDTPWNYRRRLKLQQNNRGRQRFEISKRGRKIIIEPLNPLLLASQILNIILFIRGLIVVAKEIEANKRFLLDLTDPFGANQTVAYDQTRDTELLRLTYVYDLHYIEQLINKLQLYLLLFDEHRYYLFLQTQAIDKTLIQFLRGDLPHWKSQGESHLPASVVNLIGQFLFDSPIEKEKYRFEEGRV